MFFIIYFGINIFLQVTDLLHDLESLHTSYATTAKNQKVPQLSAQAEFFNLAPRFWVLFFFIMTLDNIINFSTELRNYSHF